jgi:alkylation response protein AidB-like acyl-CoA dehydrogenase
MDLNYPPEAQRYRAAIREILTGLLPERWAGLGALSASERSAFRISWRNALREHRLLAPNWPREYGGGGLSLLEQSIVAEELALLGAPQYPHPNDANGILLLGPTLLHFGTDEQKEYFLPRTLSGEITWAQGYSEPDAGSDLFGVRTRAVRDGEGWRVTGQKIWQTAGTTANWMFALVRTDPAQGGAKGLSFLLIPLRQDGAEVRGIRNMADEIEFAEVFLDGAFVDDAHVVGGPGHGARVALGLLGFERGAGGVAAAVSARIELDRLIELTRSLDRHRDTTIRRRIAECCSEVHTMHCLALRSLSAGMSGQPPGPESSITKILTSQYRQRVTELALDILGARSLAWSGDRPIDPLKPQPRGTDALSSAAWIGDALHARPSTVYGGSLQIQRTTIGERVLGLPREPRPADHSA